VGQGKQAKVLRPRELQRLLDHVSHSRHPARDRVTVLLSFKAGLRAKEIAGLTWSMITDATGELADTISLPNRASKGKGGGRTIPLHNELRAALVSLMAVRGEEGAAPFSHRVQRARRRLQRERDCGLVHHPVPRNRDRGRIIALRSAEFHHSGSQKDHRSGR
jgi:integrase